jgi:hypothetical protein
MTAVDVFKREVKIGDYIAAATNSYKSTHLRIGKVHSISKKGNPSIRLPGRKYKDLSQIPGINDFHYVDTLVSVSIQAGKFVIISQDSLPKEFTDQLA